ncbi:hypothetical protein P4B35_11050 [Pontiellaceae bacterium B12227]|nr:hypothetical protein [Pontiellaceae bacterium B12227]
MTGLYPACYCRFNGTGKQGVILKSLIGLLAVTLLGSVATGAELEVQLDASKDTFGRSNERNGNSGASEFLLLAPMPGVVSLVGFDLSSVTNEIVEAEFSFRIFEPAREPLSLAVAAMVPQQENETWIEGAGDLGIRGQNARVGEATFQWRAFRDQPWKSEDGKDVKNMMDSRLWKSPPIKLNKVEWAEGSWISVSIKDVTLLEELRNSENKTVTYGLWGTGGKGVYKINSKESGQPTRLILKTKEKNP